MRRSTLPWLGFIVLTLVGVGCTDEGVGDPCIPETIPCDSTGSNCGYQASESYIEATSVQCRSRLCIVHKLDNGTGGLTPSDPRKICTGGDTDEPDCVEEDALKNSVYCTCRCGLEGSDRDFCKCPSGFSCEPVLTNGPEGIRGNYCVRSR